MRKKKEIRHLLNKWLILKKMLKTDDDLVSRQVLKQIEPIINTLYWVLEKP